MMEKKSTCVAMVPCPGLSHLIPLAEFAKRLVQQHHELHVTFLIPTLGPPSSSMISVLNALPPNIDFTILPQLSMEQFPHDLNPATKMRRTVQLSVPYLRDAVSSLTSRTRLVALVFDVFSGDALGVAKQFNLLSYVFYASGALTLSLCLSLPKIDEGFSSEFLDLSKTVNVPGSVVTLRVRDLPDPVLNPRSSETYKSFLDVCQRLSLVDGIIVNSFTDLEAETIRALQDVKEANGRTTPCVYPVGPIIQAESTNKDNKSECIEWLNKQPPKSVLYISFGSGGTVSHDQLNEIAFGLELSGHKFMWVVRAPNDSPNSAYLTAQKDDPLLYLPPGFLERIKGKGLVVPSWAPQVEVLAHGSTGAFLSHCGWSSTLESLVHGVPIIPWPMFAEQKMNAILLEQALKVAVRPKADDESGIIKREEIAKAIKTIMEGDEGLEIRKRIEDLRHAAAAALSENGSSKTILSSLAMKWQNI